MLNEKENYVIVISEEFVRASYNTKKVLKENNRAMAICKNDRRSQSLRRSIVELDEKEG